MTITDKLGFEIKPGDYIAYGHALGRCAGLRIGKVLKTVAEFKRDYPYQEPRWFYRVIVRGVNDDFSKLELCKTKGTLLFPQDRIIVLDPARVPQKYLDLLDPVELLDG